MKRALLFAVFLVGCGSSVPVTGGETQWSVTLGAWERPMCGSGSMTLAPTGVPSAFSGATNLSGTWNCGVYGNAAHADVRDDGRVFMDLETSGGLMNGFRGTLAADDTITGDFMLDGQLVPLSAYRQ